MANTTGGDKVFQTPWTTDPRLKLPFAVPASSTTFYPGQMLGRDASGNLVQLDDTAKCEFVGVMQDIVRPTVGTDAVVQTNGVLGDFMTEVERPLFLTCLIASAAAGDEGRKVYALYNNQVSYSPGASGNLVGHVLYVRDSTHVVVVPPWLSGVTLGGFKGIFTPAATGAIALTKWDVNKVIGLVSTANQTVTLPAASKCSPGDVILFLNLGTGYFTATVAPNGTDKINNVNAGFAMGTSYLAPLRLVCDGIANWYVEGVGWDSASVLAQFGGAAFGAVLGAVREEGNVAAAAGNPLGANAADTTDDILWGVRIPASCLDQAGRQLNVIAQGQTGGTTNNKRFKIFLNPTMAGQTLTNGVYSNVGTVTAGTPICDSGAWVNGTTPNSNVAWWAQATITKYGALGSNTQMGQGQVILGATHGGVQAGQALTLTESGTIDVVITGSSYTTGAANDVKLQQATVTGSN